MTERDVPEGEMFRRRSQSDPIDAVLGGEILDEDLTDVALIVHELKAAYPADRVLAQSPALAAFTGEHLGDISELAVTAAGSVDGSEPDAAALAGRGQSRSTNSMLTSLGAFLTTVTGKVLLTTAVAAASVGSLHVAEVVDVPLLPEVAAQVDTDVAPGSIVEATAGAEHNPDSQDLPEQAVEGQATGEANAAAAQEYASAVQDWTDCIANDAAAQGDDQTTGDDGDAYSPTGECGERPEPTDYGLGDLPDQAADNADDAVGRATPGSSSVDVTIPDPTSTSADVTVPDPTSASVDVTIPDPTSPGRP